MANDEMRELEYQVDRHEGELSQQLKQIQALQNELESMRQDIGLILSLNTQLRSAIDAQRNNVNTPGFPLAERYVELTEKYDIRFH